MKSWLTKVRQHFVSAPWYESGALISVAIASLVAGVMSVRRSRQNGTRF
jgi:hypothetical protein